MPRPVVRSRRAGGHRVRRGAGAALACAQVLAGGCRDLLRADAPQLIEESVAQRPGNAAVLVAWAVGDFECALTSYIVTAGLVTDELADAQGAGDLHNLDRRTVSPALNVVAAAPCGSLGALYTPLSVARYQADNAGRLLEGWTDEQVTDRRAQLARMAAYGGYALVLLGEAFCSAAVDRGPELSPAQLFALAEERFTRAIEVSTAAGGAAGDSLRRLALVGRARARANQGRTAEAAADAALVPTGFVFNARYVSPPARSENRVFRLNNTQGAVVVAPSFRGLTAGATPDPRVPVADAGRNALNGITRLWAQGKYASLTAPIPIATWREATLIRAEAAIAGGDVAAGVGLLNDLRRARNLATLAVPATAAAARPLLVEERRRELFLESHRLHDTIRFGVPLSPAPGTPFPTGGTYGDQKCLPLPDVERLNNPNIGGG